MADLSWSPHLFMEWEGALSFSFWFVAKSVIK